MATPPQGLTYAQVTERRAQGQGNNVAPRTSRTYGEMIRENVFTFINNVLFVLGFALILLGRTSDALVSVGVIAINIVVSLVQEVRAKKTLDKIALLTRPKATVRREGKEWVIDPSEIVLGDLLLVNPGDQIVVDGAVVEGSMEADESLLTGESDLIPKVKQAKVFSGSFCVTGAAVYEAEKVGMDSMANQLTAGARAFRRVLTPLQQEIYLMIRVLLLVAVYFELLLAINTIMNDIPLVESVKMSVVIAGLVPNGLFVTIALAYALGAVRIAGKGALVQQSNAVESLSNVDVLCLDKTGTLTNNQIKFNAMLPFDLSEAEVGARLGAFVASQSSSNRTAEAIAVAFPGKAQKVLNEVAFSSERKWSSLTLQGEFAGTYVLGAPEMVAPALVDGEMLAPQMQEWSNQGLRVLLFGWYRKPTLPVDVKDKPSLAPGMQPLGLISLTDELRPEARETLESFKQSGVRVKVISGDNPETVAALARQAGMGPELTVVSGLDLVDMSEAEFAAVADDATIFGRITPQQKEHLVRALKSRGNYVAMIGDGVNDVLSLKQANLGIAMQSGSQATRGVADIILLGDSFAALPHAVNEGQRIINGMQDVLKLFMTRVAYVALLVISITMVGGFPFSPKLASLLTLFTVGLPTLALAAWARPARINNVLLIRRLMHFVIPSAVTLSMAGLVLFLLFLAPSYQDVLAANPGITAELAVSKAMGMSQAALTIFSIFCGLLLLAFVEPSFPFMVGGDALSPDRRPTILAGVLLVVFLGVLMLPGLASFFDLARLSLNDYLIIAAAALVWGLFQRWVWRAKLMDRFLGQDFSGGEKT